MQHHSSAILTYNSALAEGCRNAKQLSQEIQSKGYGGSDVTVRRLLIPWRQWH